VGAISGASEFFLGGITAYTLNAKVEHLGVRRASARRVNAVSAEVAQQMALGVCRLFGSDLGVATTGYAEPSRAEKVTEPFAWWALADVRPRGKPTVFGGRVECPGATRVEAQAIIAAAVIAELLDYLRRIRSSRRP
jgi:nicotinamide-nucleotide amidase